VSGKINKRKQKYLFKKLSMPKTWYVAIVGRPNAGKSTLLNALIWERVSAISPRPQTTQRSIPGIYTDEARWVQIIFLDTPGIHSLSGEQYGSQKSHDIHERINSEAFASLHNADVIIRLLDPTRAYGAEDGRIDTLLTTVKAPIIRVETKQDIVMKSEKWKVKSRKDKIGKGKWEIIDGDLRVGKEEEKSSFFHHEDVGIRIDSTTKQGFDELLEQISSHLPEEPYLYSPDYYTDQSMDLRIAEVIREQLFLSLGDEIPYACYVEVTQIEEKSDKKEPMLSIQAYINVEAESQKVIVIGKWGTKISAIGTASRLILEEIFGKKVFLALRVKVAKNWRKDEKVLDKVFPRR
jgi:GTPase